MALIRSEQEKTILKYTGLHSAEFKQKRSDPKWIKTRRERHALFSKLLSKENILSLSESDFREIIKSLWAFNGWTNKDWKIDEILKESDLAKIRESLNDLLYGSDTLELRFDNFKVKYIGTASATEIMSFVNPDQYAIWNIRPRMVFPILEIDQIPPKVLKDLKISGSDYVKCNEIMKDIRTLLVNRGFAGVDLLDVDFFIRIIFEKIPKEQKIR